jgi:hypothetical protein
MAGNGGGTGSRRWHDIRILITSGSLQTISIRTLQASPFFLKGSEFRTPRHRGSNQITPGHWTGLFFCEPNAVASV